MQTSDAAVGVDSVKKASVSPQKSDWHGDCFWQRGIQSGIFSLQSPPAPVVPLATVIRIREILDPELRQRIQVALAQRRACAAAAIPDWFELDDADFVDLLNDLQPANRSDLDDPRM